MIPLNKKKHNSDRFEKKWTVPASAIAVDFLSQQLLETSKSKIKKVMEIGGVWLTRNGKMLQIRKAQKELKEGDILTLFYDEKLLNEKPLAPKLVADEKVYSVWLKPSGMLSQGSQYGDHLSLLRIVEKQLSRPCFLVHRLDREVKGLILIAHTSQCAGELSALFTENKIQKRYKAEVLGMIEPSNTKIKIDTPLDGKESTTHYLPIKINEEWNYTVVHVWIETGRKHQIRKHLQSVGHPVMGDPLYGVGNKNKAGLKLEAVELAFNYPDDIPRHYSLDRKKS